MQSKEVQTIVLNLERWRVSRNLSQTEMAKRLNISPSKYSKLISGENGTVTAEMLKDIYLATGKQCFQLMEFINDDYLRLTDLCSKMSPDEWRFMLEVATNLMELEEKIKNKE